VSRKSKRTRSRKISPWLIAVGLVGLALIGWLLISQVPVSTGEFPPISRLSTADFHSLAFSAAEPDTVFFGHHNGLMVSRDGGRSWQPTSLSNADAMALAASSVNPQIMYAAGHNVFFKSTNGGETWQAMNTNLPGLDIHGFAADPGNADRVYAHVVGFASLFTSQDGGVTWTALPGPLPASTFNLTVGETAQTLYAAAGQAGLWRSLDGGQSWSQMSKVPGDGVVALAHSRAKGRLCISTLGDEAGLYTSDDGGATWTMLGLKGTLMAVAISPHDPQRLIAVDDRGWVYASRDGGLTWSDR
jgi:photosystem II stability/assembly factor-like uncharacterized protein